MRLLYTFVLLIVGLGVFGQCPGGGFLNQNCGGNACSTPAVTGNCATVQQVCQNVIVPAYCEVRIDMQLDNLCAINLGPGFDASDEMCIDGNCVAGSSNANLTHSLVINNLASATTRTVPVCIRVNRADERAKYTVTCLSSSLTVNPIAGVTSRCQGAGSDTYTTTTTGVTWSLTPAAAGSISGAGTVTWNAGFSGTATVTASRTACTGAIVSAGTNVTVNALPAATAVAGGGTFCGSTTITASGGAGGTIYFQGTTSGGTSTATPSTSQLITASGTYYFRSRSAAGCWGPEGSATVTINPVPAATAVAGGGTFCGSTTITASGGAGGTIYFQGTTSGGTSTATPSTSQLITASGTYYFRSRSAAGCWGPEGSATVTINPVPAATAVAGGGTFCGSTTITASGGAGGTIYFQGTTSGGTSTATPSTSQLITASGTYYFRSRSAAGCWGPEGSATVTINPVPAATAVAGGGTFCGSTTITASGGAGGTIYFQGTTSGGTSTATPSTSQLITASGTYYFRSRSAAGCWGPEGSATVTINPVPAATAVAGGGTFCGSTTITASGGAGGTIYFQGTTSGGTSTATPSTSQLITASGTYYFRSRSAAGCWGPEGSATVTINPVPAATAVAGGGTFCGSTTITASGGAGGTIYFQGTTSGGTSTATPSTSQLITASGTYYFRSRSAAGCWGPEGSATVTINPVPAATAVAGGGTFCGSTTITASGGAGGTIYFQGTTSGGTSTATPSTSQLITASGTYYFRSRSAAGCWGPEGSATVTINPVPAATIVSGGGTFCAPSTVITASGGAGGTIYFQGTTSGGTSTATPSTSQLITASGTYYFRSRSAAGCWGPEGSATVNLITGTITYTWTGAASTSDWFTPGNWTGGCGIPTCADNVIIAPAAFQPQINATAACRNMTIQAGATLTILGTNLLQVCGDWLQNGSFVSNNSTVAFIGTTTQQFTSGGLGDFYNVQLNNPQFLDLNSNMILKTGGGFSFLQGIVRTAANELIIQNNSVSAVTGYGINSYVQGNLRRAVVTASGYDFPVGTSTLGYQLANITFTAGPLGFTELVARFDDYVVAPSVSLLELSYNFSCVISNHGKWTIDPNFAPNPAMRYTMTGYPRMTIMGCVPSCVQWTIMKQPTAASSSWALEGDAGSGYSGTLSSGTPIPRTGLSSFSEFAAVGALEPLPAIELNLRARLAGANRAILNWNSDLNPSKYNLLRRKYQEANFEQIYSGLTREYVDNTLDPSARRYVYRLQAIDVNGNQIGYDEAEVQLINENYFIRIYPNPVSDRINIRVATTGESVDYQLYDALGKQLIDYQSDASEFEMNLASLASGVYFIKAVNDQGLVLGTQRVVKY